MYNQYVSLDIFSYVDSLMSAALKLTCVHQTYVISVTCACKFVQ